MKLSLPLIIICHKLVEVAKNMFLTAAEKALSPEGYAEIKAELNLESDKPNGGTFGFFAYFVELAMSFVTFDIVLGGENPKTSLEFSQMVFKQLSRSIVGFITDPTARELFEQGAKFRAAELSEYAWFEHPSCDTFFEKLAELQKAEPESAPSDTEDSE